MKSTEIMNAPSPDMIAVFLQGRYVGVRNKMDNTNMQINIFYNF